MNTAPSTFKGIGGPQRRSSVVCAALGLVVAAFHFIHGSALAHSVLMQSFNWVFDFDSSRYVGGWCAPGAEVADQLEMSFTVRHPLSYAMRPLCLALHPLFRDAALALAALTALCAGACASLAYLIAARFCRAEFDRLLLALGFALSAQPLLLGVIPETYGFALAGIGLYLWLICRPPVAQPLATAPAVLCLVLNLGITVTNAGLNLIAAAVLGWHRMGWRRWLRGEVRVWLIAGLVVALLLGFSVWWFAPQLAATADAAPRRLWWAININRAEPATLARVATTYLIYDVVAPVMVFIDLPPPESHPMADFRLYRFGLSGTLAAPLWCAALAFGSCAVWRARQHRRLLLLALLWLLFNVLLHGYWQYRGSIYIYGAHTSFVLYLLAVLGYSGAVQGRRAWAVRAGALALTVLVAINNLASYAAVMDFLLRQTPAP